MVSNNCWQIVTRRYDNSDYYSIVAGGILRSSRSLAKQSSGTSGDQGRSLLRFSRLLFGLIDGISDNNHFRYRPGQSPLALAVWIIVNQPALISAPASVKLNRLFFL